MGMSRRKFTKEFREEAVRRLELGASLSSDGCQLHSANLFSSPSACRLRQQPLWLRVAFHSTPRLVYTTTRIR
jgi:hypothetical protein